MINNDLLKKVILNALSALAERLDCDGCNDLFSDEPLLIDVSKAELMEIQKEWNRLFPKKVKEYGKKLRFDTQVLETIIKLTESSKIVPPLSDGVSN